MCSQSPPIPPLLRALADPPSTTHELRDLRRVGVPSHRLHSCIQHDRALCTGGHPCPHLCRPNTSSWERASCPGALSATKEGPLEGGVKKKQPNPPQPSPSAGINGIIAVHKPTNWTSFDVVAKVRSTLNRHVRESNPGLTAKQCRVKVGHGGTLDPAATGVLVIGIGKGTKALDLYTKGQKSYRAVGLFGFETDTGDAEGVQVGDAVGFEGVTQEGLEEALSKFVGDIMQVPPAFSAIKKDGKKAYELARKGQEVVMEPRAVTVHSMSLSRPFGETSPEFEIEVTCGGGTYIRSLVRDIGRELGTAAHMKALVRTVQGEFSLEDCIEHEDIYDSEKVLSEIPKSEERLQGLLEKLKADKKNVNA